MMIPRSEICFGNRKFPLCFQQVRYFGQGFESPHHLLSYATTDDGSETENCIK